VHQKLFQAGQNILRDSLALLILVHVRYFPRAIGNKPPEGKSSSVSRPKSRLGSRSTIAVEQGQHRIVNASPFEALNNSRLPHVFPTRRSCTSFARLRHTSPSWVAEGRVRSTSVGGPCSLDQGCPSIDAKHKLHFAATSTKKSSPAGDERGRFPSVSTVLQRGRGQRPRHSQIPESHGKAPCANE
jgi:hypothetical protein